MSHVAGSPRGWATTDDDDDGGAHGAWPELPAILGIEAEAEAIHVGGVFSIRCVQR
jgi:hypothetical protein